MEFSKKFHFSARKNAFLQKMDFRYFHFYFSKKIFCEAKYFYGKIRSKKIVYVLEIIFALRKLFKNVAKVPKTPKSQKVGVDRGKKYFFASRFKNFISEAINF